VNHGSHSETWRQALTDLESRVRNGVMADGRIQGMRTAFMEYTEPSIATQLKQFDAEGFTDIIIVPIFLTVSPHTHNDIPNIIGQKEDARTIEMLNAEKIERYRPRARTYTVPNLDFTDILMRNVAHRVKELSMHSEREGLVLIGYGDETYEKEWGDLFDRVANYVNQEVGVSDYTYGWCGHIVRYSPEKTTEAVERILSRKEKAIVIPVLVAHDEMFQVRIIGRGIDQVSNRASVVYRPDAILPDVNVEQWVIDITAEYLNLILNG